MEKPILDQVPFLKLNDHALSVLRAVSGAESGEIPTLQQPSSHVDGKHSALIRVDLDWLRVWRLDMDSRKIKYPPRKVLQGINDL